MTLPVVVVLVFAIAALTHTSSAPHPSASNAPPPPITVAAPPSSPATEAACTKVLEQLPTQLDGLNPRVVHTNPSSPFVVAWGDPAVVLSCGVARPGGLKPGSAEFVPVVDGVAFFTTDTGDRYVYTTIDRAAYVQVSLPKSRGAGPLPRLADAIARALPAVCVPQAGPGETPPAPSTLCTNRK
ncbi:MAG: DUF3515 domain-containing protein [Jatrophihabitantaceae bacterium]